MDREPEDVICLDYAGFIAKKKGIKAVGFNATDVRASYGFITHVREWGARCKVFLVLLFGKKPRHSFKMPGFVLCR